MKRLFLFTQTAEFDARALTHFDALDLTDVTHVVLVTGEFQTFDGRYFTGDAYLLADLKVSSEVLIGTPTGAQEFSWDAYTKVELEERFKLGLLAETFFVLDDVDSAPAYATPTVITEV